MLSGVHFLLQAPGGNLAVHLRPLRSASALGKAVQLVDVYIQASDEGQMGLAFHNSTYIRKTGSKRWVKQSMKAGAYW